MLLTQQSLILILDKKDLIAVGFEPTPVTTGALNQRLRPLGHATSHLPILAFQSIYFTHIKNKLLIAFLYLLFY